MPIKVRMHVVRRYELTYSDPESKETATFAMKTLSRRIKTKILDEWMTADETGTIYIRNARQNELLLNAAIEGWDLVDEEGNSIPCTTENKLNLDHEGITNFLLADIRKRNGIASSPTEESESEKEGNGSESSPETSSTAVSSE